METIAPGNVALKMKVSEENLILEITNNVAGVIVMEFKNAYYLFFLLNTNKDLHRSVGEIKKPGFSVPARPKGSMNSVSQINFLSALANDENTIKKRFFLTTSRFLTSLNRGKYQ